MTTRSPGTHARRDEIRDDVERLSTPGHDRDCAIAILAQARRVATDHGSLSNIQVRHLLSIGRTAGFNAGRQAVVDRLREHRETLGRFNPGRVLLRGIANWIADGAP